MASYIQGYDEERFASTVNRNFLCLICFNVMKAPVQCPRNQHCFCRACITKHLENSPRCPTCADELTVETLADAPRMVKDMLNELNIHCVYIDRGCQEVVQLQQLDSHEDTCGYTPAVCTNQGCGATVNKRDRIHHESEVCEFRRLKCHSCEKTEKTLADIEKRIANGDKNIEKNMAAMETKLTNIETKMERNTAEMEGKLELVNNEMLGLQTALIEGFGQMKEVLVKMENEMEKITRKVRNAASGDKDNIIVAGGFGTNKVEIFNWCQGKWSPLQSLPEKRFGTTSFVYSNQMGIVGGCSNESGFLDDMIRINTSPNPDLPPQWFDSPVKLPAKLVHHSSVLYKDQLIVTGGKYENTVSDCINEVQLVPPYTAKALLRMPQARQDHSTEIFDDRLLIVGGSTTGEHKDSLSSVLLYDIKKNKCKQLSPLPYEVHEMGTVRWGDNIVILGGVDGHDNTLDKVIMYNVKTEQSHMLPSMRCKRRGCAAVVIGNNIVVLGGWGALVKLPSVEAFNFERYTWEELPQMSVGRWLHAAVVV